MVCLTSCVFRSIRFSGFARPHLLGCGARENYTRTRRLGARAGDRMHKMDTSRGIIVVWAGFRGPGCQTGPGAGGAHGPARPLQFRAGSNGPAFIHFLAKRCMFGQPFGRPDRPPAHGPARPRPMPSDPDTYTALRPARRFGLQSRAFSRPPSRGRQPGPALWPGP